jgi:hypothetical protein
LSDFKPLSEIHLKVRTKEPVLPARFHSRQDLKRRSSKFLQTLNEFQVTGSGARLPYNKYVNLVQQEESTFAALNLTQKAADDKKTS